MMTLSLYLFATYILVKNFGFSLGNAINPVLYILLVMLVFSLSYSFSFVSNKVLQKNDISYSVYIYHIPVINIFIYYGIDSSFKSVVFALFLTLVLAIASWLYIEKTSLKLKKHPLNPLNKNTL